MKRLAIIRAIFTSALGLTFTLSTAPTYGAVNPQTMPAWNATAGWDAPSPTYNGPMGCPDPDVFPYQGSYVASCTTGTLRPGMPIYSSSNLQNWTLKGYINPPTDMLLQNGQEWADEIHHYSIGWVAFYAVQLPSGQMVIVQSWSPDLFASNWQTRILYQDTTNPGAQWTIDPSVQPDPVKKGVYDMVFQEEGTIRIIGLHLGTKGLDTFGHPRIVSYASLPWEHGWEEGPVLWRVKHQEFMFMNTGNTWDGTYSIGVQRIIGSPLTGRYIKDKRPLLTSDPAYPDLEGPGIGAQPFRGPHGEWLLAYHVDPPANSYGMASRPLCFTPLSLPENQALLASRHHHKRTRQHTQLSLPMPHVPANHPLPTTSL